MSITVKQISCFLGYLPSYFSYEWYQKASSVGINQYQIKMVDVVEKIKGQSCDRNLTNTQLKMQIRNKFNFQG